MEKLRYFQEAEVLFKVSQVLRPNQVTYKWRVYASALSAPTRRCTCSPKREQRLNPNFNMPIYSGWQSRVPRCLPLYAANPCPDQRDGPPGLHHEHLRGRSARELR